MTSSLGYFSAVIRVLVSFAPTTSWWWKETRPSGSKRRVFGLPMSCSSAASRSVRSGPSVLQVDGLLQHRQGVLVDVLVPVVLVALQPQGGQLGQHPVGEPGLDQQPQSLARVVGRAAACSARHGPARPTRSRSARPSPSSPRPPRARPRSPAGRRNGPPASSAAGHRRRTPRGCPGVRSTRAARSSRPPYGSMKSLSGSATAIAFTVKSRRTRSSSMVSP